MYLSIWDEALYFVYVPQKIRKYGPFCPVPRPLLSIYTLLTINMWHSYTHILLYTNKHYLLRCNLCCVVSFEGEWFKNGSFNLGRDFLLFLYLQKIDKNGSFPRTTFAVALVQLFNNKIYLILCELCSTVSCRGEWVKIEPSIWDENLYFLYPQKIGKNGPFLPLLWPLLRSYISLTTNTVCFSVLCVIQ